MKRILMIGAMAMLAGCGEVPVPHQSADETRPSEMLGSLRLYTDPDTDCQYLVTVGGGITPRMDSDGQQICTPKQPG